MARLPWLSASCSRSELDSSSSLSLLHSIYGSQVSQVLLASDDSDFRSDDSARPDSLAVARRASRPKSSPAVTRLERQRSDVETAVHVVPKQKPRARPATAGVRRSVSLQRGGAVGRPKSALTVGPKKTRGVYVWRYFTAASRATLTLGGRGGRGELCCQERHSRH
jgi:hypothetical protein